MGEYSPEEERVGGTHESEEEVSRPFKVVGDVPYAENNDGEKANSLNEGHHCPNVVETGEGSSDEGSERDDGEDGGYGRSRRGGKRQLD